MPHDGYPQKTPTCATFKEELPTAAALHRFHASIWRVKTETKPRKTWRRVSERSWNKGSQLFIDTCVSNWLDLVKKTRQCLNPLIKEQVHRLTLLLIQTWGGWKTAGASWLTGSPSRCCPVQESCSTNAKRIRNRRSGRTAPLCCCRAAAALPSVFVLVSGARSWLWHKSANEEVACS